MMQPARRLTIHRALLRPILLAGGERTLVMINGTVIVTLVVGVGINAVTITCAILLATLGQWCLSQAGKADPFMSQIYLRHVRYQDYYPAQTSVHAKPAVIRPSIELRGA